LDKDQFDEDERAEAEDERKRRAEESQEV